MYGWTLAELDSCYFYLTGANFLKSFHELWHSNNGALHFLIYACKNIKPYTLKLIVCFIPYTAQYIELAILYTYAGYPICKRYRLIAWEFRCVTHSRVRTRLLQHNVTIEIWCRNLDQVLNLDTPMSRASHGRITPWPVTVMMRVLYKGKHTSAQRDDTKDRR